MTRKNNATEFIEEIYKYILDVLKLNAQKEYRLDTTSWCAKADICIALGKTMVFVEVDEGQPHPDTNVVKYWHWINNKGMHKRIILIHIFGKGFYDNNYRSRTQLCSFITNKMKKEKINFVYVPIPSKMQHQYKKNWEIFTLLPQTKRKLKEIIKKSSSSIKCI